MSTTSSNSPVAPSKAAQILKLISRGKGATLAEMGAATGWQPHSCRAFLSGLRKKGYVFLREARGDGAAAYKIAGSATRKPVPVKTATAPPVIDSEATGAASVNPAQVG